MRVPCGHRVAAAPGLAVVDGLDGSVSALTADSGAPAWSRQVGKLAGSLALSPDSKTVYGVTLHGDLLALDPATGGERWRRSLGEEFFEPVAVGEDGFLAVRSKAGTVYGVEPDGGSVLWRQPMKDLARGPIVAPDGTVLVTDYSLNVHALQRNDGTPRWVYPARSTVCSLDTDASTVYVGRDYGRVTALDLATGAERWSVIPNLSGERSQNSPSLLVQEEEGRLLVSDDDGHLFALQAKDGSVAWSTKETSWRRSPPVLREGQVCSGTQDRAIHAVNDDTGARTWSWQIAENTLAWPSASPDGMVYLTDDSGAVHAARPEERFLVAAERAMEDLTGHQEPSGDVEVADEWVQIGDVRVPRQAG